MAEPSTSTGVGLTVLVVGLFGPLAGPYALIVMAALAGALWPLSSMTETTKTTGALFLLRIVLTAVALTGTTAWWLENHYQIPAIHSMAIVSFIIGALGNGWTRVFEAVRESLSYLITRLSRSPNDPADGAPK